MHSPPRLPRATPAAQRAERRLRTLGTGSSHCRLLGLLGAQAGHGPMHLSSSSGSAPVEARLGASITEALESVVRTLAAPGNRSFPCRARAGACAHPPLCVSFRANWPRALRGIALRRTARHGRAPARACQPHLTGAAGWHIVSELLNTEILCPFYHATCWARVTVLARRALTVTQQGGVCAFRRTTPPRVSGTRALLARLDVRGSAQYRVGVVELRDPFWSRANG